MTFVKDIPEGKKLIPSKWIYARMNLDMLSNINLFRC